MEALIIGGFIVIFIVSIIIANIRIVPQTKSYVIERLGTYNTTWDSGLNFKFPFIDKIAKKVSLKEIVVDFPPQPVITKDNVTMKIDTVVFYQITDPKLFTYGVASPIIAIENLTATTLRNIIGDMELDQTLTSRDIVNTRMRSTLDEATDPWGIKISRVELKNILPPKDIQEAMEKQMRAERERRESIIIAEGDKRSSVLRAEGEKESRILQAEAKKRERILDAEANKESQVRIAEGEAEAILKVATAKAESFEVLNSNVPKPEILQLKAMNAFIEASKGEANKIIIPTDLANVVGFLTGVVDSIKK
ncbi:SPFH/Band 7/PHB domain protein [bacterium AH-315-K05]|nr:SPFH/Band 7/PHB domain protein [bacterium AH-315-K05]MBN4074707.1 SPFH/Band 7/PHB domain protein [bacterium AH-315-E09]